MALYASILLIGAIVVALVVLVAMYLASRHVVGPEIAESSKAARLGSKDTARMWSAHVGSLDETPPVPHVEEIPAWKLHVQAAQAGDPGIYKTRSSTPFRGEHWNPYDESQSTASRVRAARRKPRPQRSPPSDPIEGLWQTVDPYALLGISRVASTEEIEQAYRRRVAKIHPDKFHSDPVGRQDAHEKLKQLNSAMRLLRERRSQPRYESN